MADWGATLRYFEDLKAGEPARPYGGYTVTAAEIDHFDRVYDPDFAARAPALSTPMASGWLVAGINMRMVCDSFVKDTASMGGPGLDRLEWLKPVHAGDILRAQRTILDMRASKSRPEMGFVRFGVEVFNQRDDVVMTQRHLVMVQRRGAVQQPRPVTPRPASPPGNAPAAHATGADAPAPAFEAVTIGATFDLGAVHFDRQSVIAFATAYDPQPFHVDEDAAKRSHFGGLVASGWHTAAGWSRAAHARDRRLYGTAAPRRGRLRTVSELNWRHPVYAGDTIRYATRIEAKHPSDEADWGLVETYNTGTDQTGALVFDFRATQLWRKA